MARIRKSSFLKHPDQFSMFGEPPVPPKAPAHSPPPFERPADTSDKPSVLRRAVRSGLNATGDVIKEGARDAAVSGVKWSIGVVLAGTGVGSYLWLAPAEQPKPHQQPIQVESTPSSPKSDAIVTGSIPSKQEAAPQVKSRIPRKKKSIEKQTTTRIFILEDIVEWLKRTSPN